MSWELSDTWWLKVVWASGILFIASLFIFRAQAKALKKVLGEKAEFLTASLSPGKRKLHLILQCGALACFALALARPLMGTRQAEVKQTGFEMVIAVDVSNSMLAEDDKPSRLEHAKKEFQRLLDNMTGNRVGLIAFAGNAILASPMTTDYSAIKMFLDSFSTSSVSNQGTNFKAVVDEAIRAFDRGGIEAPNGIKPTRVLLIGSDGEDNEPGGMAEVKKALDSGIRIFTLGFGSKRGAPIPIRDDRGGLTGYKKDKKGQVVVSIPSDEGLAKLAQEGGGSFYHTTFDESEIRNLIGDLDQLQKSDFKTKMATEFDEKFQIPLLVGLLLALIDFTFGDRRRKGLKWRGRFDRAA